MSTGSASSGRRRMLASFARGNPPRAGFNFGSTAMRIYGLLLLLFLMLLFLVMFEDRTPTVLDRVFQPPLPDEATQLARHKKLEGFLNGALLDAKDGDDFAETPGYRRLLQHLMDHVRPEDVVKEPFKFDRMLAMRDPDALRGETVRVRGVVPVSVKKDGLWAQKLDTPLFSTEAVWRMVLMDSETDQGVFIDMIERPDHFDLARDVVEVDAMFYRKVSFAPLNAKKLTDRREAPYLLARSVRVIPDQRAGLLGPNHNLAILLGFILFTLAAWGVVRVTLAHRKTNPRANSRPFHQLLAPGPSLKGDEHQPNSTP